MIDHSSFPSETSRPADALSDEQRLCNSALTSGEYDEDARTLTYNVTVLEQKSGQLAEFGDNAEIPSEAYDD